MKKNRLLFLIIFTLLVFIPFGVNAENNKDYNISVKNLEEYMCEEVKGHSIYISMQTYNKIAVYDETTDKEYLIDFSNIGVCEEYKEEEIEPDSERYEYVWDENNLYLETYKSDLMFSHAKTLDKTIEPNSSYSELKQDGFYHVSNPTVENLSNYYEMYYFELATGEYDENETYYEIKTYQYSLDGFDGDYTLATTKEIDETTFEINKYYVIAKPTKKDLIGQFNSDTFVVPKEKSGLTADINLSKYDFRNHFEFSGKTYYVFVNLETGDHNLAIFDVNGNYQTFGLNNLIPMNIDITDDNKYVSFLAKVDEKNHLVLLNDEHNVMVLNDVSEYGDDISFIGYYGSDFYYLVHRNGRDDIIEINYNKSNKDYVVTLDANGGKFKDSDKYIIDDIINFDYINFNKPTREGYEFIGFFTELDGGKSFEEVMNSEAGIEEDTIFYARWKEISGGAVVTEPEEENPKTFDGIGTSIYMGTISLIGLIGATIYLRRKKVRV